MARPVRKRRVMKLQERFLRQQGATEQEIREWRPYLTAQIGAESNFQTNLGSSAGARDVAQFMPTTAPSYGVTLGDNKIKDDIRGQVRYMLPLLRRHGVEGALRAYNAGPAAIEASKSYAETNAYVSKIQSSASQYKGLASGSAGAVRQAGSQGRLTPGKAPQLLAGGTTTDAKSAMLAALLDPRKGMSLIDRFQERIDSGQFTTTVGPTSVPGVAPRYVDTQRGTHRQPGQGGGGGWFQKLKAEANRIDEAEVPYLWPCGQAEARLEGHAAGLQRRREPHPRHQPTGVGPVHVVGRAGPRPEGEVHRLRQRGARPRGDRRPLLGHVRVEPGGRRGVDPEVPDQQGVPVPIRRPPPWVISRQSVPSVGRYRDARSRRSQDPGGPS
jgi:hypothetical protein